MFPGPSFGWLSHRGLLIYLSLLRLYIIHISLSLYARIHDSRWFSQGGRQQGFRSPVHIRLSQRNVFLRLWQNRMLRWGPLSGTHRHSQRQGGEDAYLLPYVPYQRQCTEDRSVRIVQTLPEGCRYLPEQEQTDAWPLRRKRRTAFRPHQGEETRSHRHRRRRGNRLDQVQPRHSRIRLQKGEVPGPRLREIALHQRLRLIPSGVGLFFFLVLFVEKEPKQFTLWKSKQNIHSFLLRKANYSL